MRAYFLFVIAFACSTTFTTAQQWGDKPYQLNTHAIGVDVSVSGGFRGKRDPRLKELVGVGFKVGVTDLYALTNTIGLGLNLTYSEYQTKEGSLFGKRNEPGYTVATSRFRYLLLKPFAHYIYTKPEKFKPFVSLGVFGGTLLDAFSGFEMVDLIPYDEDNITSRYKPLTWGIEAGIGSRIPIKDNFITIKATYELGLMYTKSPNAFERMQRFKNINLSLFYPIFGWNFSKHLD